jgi:hypothetical protein
VEGLVLVYDIIFVECTRIHRWAGSLGHTQGSSTIELTGARAVKGGVVEGGGGVKGGGAVEGGGGVEGCGAKGGGGVEGGGAEIGQPDGAKKNSL